MAKKYRTYTTDSADDKINRDNIWVDEIDIEETDWNISSGSIDTDNIDVNWNSNFLLPNAVDDILFYDKTYLVTKIEGETSCYKIGDEYDVTEVKISDSYSTKMNCKPIEFDKLPQYIRDSVLEEEI